MYEQKVPSENQPEANKPANETPSCRDNYELILQKRSEFNELVVSRSWYQLLRKLLTDHILSSYSEPQANANDHFPTDPELQIEINKELDHAEEVAFLSFLFLSHSIAEDVGLENKRIVMLAIASTLHDVGKFFSNNAALTKETRRMPILHEQISARLIAEWFGKNEILRDLALELTLTSSDIDEIIEAVSLHSANCPTMYFLFGISKNAEVQVCDYPFGQWPASPKLTTQVLAEADHLAQIEITTLMSRTFDDEANEAVSPRISQKLQFILQMRMLDTVHNGTNVLEALQQIADRVKWLKGENLPPNVVGDPKYFSLKHPMALEVLKIVEDDFNKLILFLKKLNLPKIWGDHGDREVIDAIDKQLAQLVK
ncbi:MAG: HD domain-containing protein [Patescibacteria group bacterium]